MAHHQRSNSRRRLTVSSKSSPMAHAPLLSTIPGSPHPGQAFEFGAPGSPVPGTPSKFSFSGFQHLQDTLRSKPSVPRVPRQVQRRATYIALLALVGLATYVFFLSKPLISRGVVDSWPPVPERVAQGFAPDGLSHPPAGHGEPARKLKGSSWRKAKAANKERPQVVLDMPEELAAVTAFMASLAENRIPDDVDPTKPLDPDLILDFDTRSQNARSEVEELVRDTWQRNPVVLFGKRYSPQAREMRGMLDALNLAPAPTYFDVDSRADALIVEPLLARLTHDHELPVLLVAGEPLGTVEELRMLNADGKLAELVTAAGAKVDGKKKKGGRKH